MAIKDFMGPVSGPIEKAISLPIMFSMIIMYQGLFSGKSVRMPERVERAFSNPWFRLFSLFMVALSATGDVEYAIITTVIFLSLLYALKTDSEREKDGFI
jgi:hypothetical protein